MYINNTQCCAVQEISDLCVYEGNPEKALKVFCKRHETPVYSNTGSYKRIGSQLHPDHIYAFYIFTGVVGNKNDEYGENDDHVDAVSYGPEFAAYIKEHGLGVVIESPKRPNRTNHPTHLVRVWVWAPSISGLLDWWDKNKSNSK